MKRTNNWMLKPFDQFNTFLKNIKDSTTTWILFTLIIGVLFGFTYPAEGQPLMSRVKDIARLDGVQDNPLYGYGLVAGLEGTGDGASGFTPQSLANMMGGMGVNVRQDQVVADNVAAVMVVANLPPFARPGMKVDCTVMSIGQSESLQGGYLLPTPLKGMDNEFHGLAQGPISIGGFVAGAGGGGAGAGAASVQKNHAAVGMIPAGVIIEGEPVSHDYLQEGSSLRWLLLKPDFKTASNMERKINSMVEEEIAVAEDAGAIRVFVRMDENENIVLGKRTFPSLVDAIAFIDDALVEAEEAAKIVINERTGTVIAGQDIKVRPVLIAHGPLRITIQETPEVSQAGLGPGGETEVTQQVQVTAEEGDKTATFEGTTVRDMVESLKQVGFTPRDLIAIFQTMAQYGAIKAEVVMVQ